MGVLEEIAADLAGYHRVDPRSPLLLWLTKSGLWLSAHHRLRAGVVRGVRVPVLRPALLALFSIGARLLELATGCVLGRDAHVGPGLVMTHAHGIIVHGDARIGSHCHLGHEVTIGTGGRGAREGVPTLGDRVFVGPGAKLFGAIRIGDDAAIGANAVVTADVPAGTTAVGVPARVVSDEGSAAWIPAPGRDARR